jgi:hypothetical protein
MLSSLVLKKARDGFVWKIEERKALRFCLGALFYQTFASHKLAVRVDLAQKASLL